jgi:hypothetical protein
MLVSTAERELRPLSVCETLLVSGCDSAQGGQQQRG